MLHLNVNELLVLATAEPFSLVSVVKGSSSNEWEDCFLMKNQNCPTETSKVKISFLSC